MPFADGLGAADHLPLRNRIHGIDVVHARSAIVLTLMHRIHAQVSGPALWVGSAPLPNRDLPRLSVLYADANLPIRCRLPQVVNMGRRDLRQSLEPRVAENRPSALAEVPHGRAGKILMRRVHLGQQRNILARVAPPKMRPLRRLSLHMPRFHPAPDQARHLSSAHRRDFGQEPPHDTLLPLAELAILLPLEYPLYQSVNGPTLHRRPADMAIGADELLHLDQGELLQVLHPQHPTFRFQAHLALESSSRFRLTPHWNRSPRSGSFRIGQFYRLRGEARTIQNRYEGERCPRSSSKPARSRSSTARQTARAFR